MKFPLSPAAALPSIAAGLHRFALPFALALACSALASSAFAQTARFIGAVTPLPGNIADPYGIAVDSHGHVFIACATSNQVLMETPSGTGYTVSVLANEVDNPEAVAVDILGNVYIAQNGAGNILKETLLNNKYTQSVLLSGFDAPTGIAVDVHGNLYISDSGANKVYKETLYNDHYTQSTVRGGLNFPSNLAVSASGDIYITDANNNRVLKETPSGSGFIEHTVGANLKSPAGVAVDTNGNVYIADYQNYRLLKEVPEGTTYAQSVIPTTAIDDDTPGDVAVDANGNLFISFFVGDGYDGFAVRQSQTGANFGKVSVGSSSSTISLLFNAETAGELASLSSLTQGAPGSDFQIAGTGTCFQGIELFVGENCTVDLTFKPTLAGTRSGAVDLLNTASKSFATGFAQGTGVAPQVAFLPGTQSAIPYRNVGEAYPDGIAIDAAGNVYIADAQNNYVFKETPSGASYSYSLVGTGLNSPAGLAVDAAGNLYIADTQNNRVLKESPSGAGYTQTAIGAGLDNPYGVAVDAAGNVYIADTVHSRVLKETLYAGFYTQSTLPLTGVDYLFGIAADGAGNVYVTDPSHKQVVKLTNYSGVYVQSTIVGGLNLPFGVAVDAVGNVYVSDFNAGEVYKATLSGSSYSLSTLPATGLSSPYGVATDSLGNVYITDPGTELVTKMDFADPPSLTFDPTTVGSVSSDSPREITLENIGNAPLPFPAPPSGQSPSITANFTLNSLVSSACPVLNPSITTPVNLPPNDSCVLAIGFAPTKAGSLTGSLTILDGALNAAAPAWTTQTLALSGKATPQKTSLVWTNPHDIVYGAALTATQLDATAVGGIPGTFVYSPAAGKVLSAGTHLLSVTFTPANTAVYAPSTAATAIIVFVAPLTVTAKSVSVPYGAPIPALTYTVTGFVNGDTTAALTGAPAESTTATSASLPGNYPIALVKNTLAAANYDFKLVNGTLTVTPLGTVATPTFTPVAGVYAAAQNVAIKDTTPGAVIYYTTDNSTPTALSTKYTAAIPVAASKTIKAIAVVPGYTQSAVAAAAYTIQ